MNLARRNSVVTIHQLQYRADAGWVFRRPFEPDTQTGFSNHIMIELCLRAVLGDHQVQAAVPIKVGRGAPSLFAVNPDPGLLSTKGFEFSGAVTCEQQAQSAIVAR